MTLDLNTLSEEFGLVSRFKVALNGGWETGLEIAPDETFPLERIDGFIADSRDVAFQVFFESIAGRTSFVGVRLADFSKVEQRKKIAAAFEAVKLGGWLRLTDVVVGLRELIDESLFPKQPHLLEVGVVGAWKSIGSVVIWRQDEDDEALEPSALRKRVSAHAPLLDFQSKPIGLEFGFEKPVPHWLAMQVSDVTASGHRLNTPRVIKLAAGVKMNARTKDN